MHRINPVALFLVATTTMAGQVFLHRPDVGALIGLSIVTIRSLFR